MVEATFPWHIPILEIFAGWTVVKIAARNQDATLASEAPRALNVNGPIANCLRATAASGDLA